MVKNPPANAGDTGLIRGPGRFHMPWYLQSPKFRHMVETCHRKSSNVVIVESAVE